jgi:hypothetical protein
MELTPEALYFQLGHLVAELPELATGATTPEAEQWLRRAGALIEASGGMAEVLQFRVAVQNLDGPLRARNAETIAEIVRRAFARAELEAPPAAQGTFIVAKDAVDAFVAVRKILATAENEVLLVDPAADAKALTDVALLAPDHVVLRLLADQDAHKASLRSATQRWIRRFGAVRPLYVRLAGAGILHATLILIDGTAAWALRTSFSKLAKGSDISLVRIPPRAASSMIDAYAAHWDAAASMRWE